MFFILRYSFLVKYERLKGFYLINLVTVINVRVIYIGPM